VKKTVKRAPLAAVEALLTSGAEFGEAASFRRSSVRAAPPRLVRPSLLHLGVAALLVLTVVAFAASRGVEPALEPAPWTELAAVI
jgi:hypothetical protein